MSASVASRSTLESGASSHHLSIHSRSTGRPSRGSNYASMSQIRDLLMESGNAPATSSSSAARKKRTRILQQACRETHSDFASMQARANYYANMGTSKAINPMTAMGGPMTVGGLGGPSSMLPSDVLFLDVPRRGPLKQQGSALRSPPREVLFAPSPPRRRRSPSPPATQLPSVSQRPTREQIQELLSKARRNHGMK